MYGYGKVANREGKISSVQVSILQNVPAGDFFPGVIFLIKNITDDNITAEIRPAGQDKQSYIQDGILRCAKK